ncbi:hypothetical protein BB561_001049 [Smittium simulii]|uniref:Endoplasmic reticulum vesicle transporter C-terminal domain-containing protein n=1 Tax=Smittium simulii TaxID=133385 RepID=A0A2T9YWG8_9FUNG|nr:hypothetical protein BB561_001049 [Smittium simulii]
MTPVTQSFGEKQLFNDNMGFLDTFRKMDMFTKVEASHQNSTTHGGVMSIVVAAIIFFVSFLEISEYFKYQESHHFVVDNSIDHMLAINFDITVNSKCSALSLDLTDLSGSFKNIKSTMKREDATQLGINHHLSLKHKDQDHIHDIIRLSSKKIRPKRFSAELKNTPKTACRFYGTVLTNKVKGSIQITGVGRGLFRTFAIGDNNFTHVIDELSFGTFYPSLVNPLDNTYQVSEQGHFCMDSFLYSVSVIPTIYKGIDGTELPTNQYSVHQQTVPIKTPFDNPGIFISYDIEPIMVKVSEVRVPFTKFLIKLCSIIGGIFVTTGIFLRILDFKPSSLKKTIPQKNNYGIIDSKVTAASNALIL